MKYVIYKIVESEQGGHDLTKPDDFGLIHGSYAVSTIEHELNAPSASETAQSLAEGIREFMSENAQNITYTDILSALKIQVRDYEQRLKI